MESRSSKMPVGPRKKRNRGKDPSICGFGLFVWGRGGKSPRHPGNFQKLKGYECRYGQGKVDKVRAEGEFRGETCSCRLMRGQRKGTKSEGDEAENEDRGRRTKLRLNTPGWEKERTKGKTYVVREYRIWWGEITGEKARKRRKGELKQDDREPIIDGVRDKKGQPS